MERQDADANATPRKPRVKSPDRSRIDPNPRKLDDLVPEDDEVRLIWAMTLELDLQPLQDEIKSVEGGPGRPAIDPAILVALWIHATVEGISSAREVERRCYRDDGFKWLRGGVDVNHHTLGDFRVAHGDWLDQQVVNVVAALSSEGLVDLNEVGQDGMRVRASAGSGSFKRATTLDEHARKAEEQWDRLQQEFADGSSSAASAGQSAARERAARERLERLEQAKRQVATLAAAREKRKKGDGEQARASATDPEARKMKMGDNGYRPAYNVQFATTLDTLMIVGVDVTNSGSDGGQMEPMVQRIIADHGEAPNEYYTDGGFSTIDDIEKVGKLGSTVYTPVKEAERQQREGKDPYAPRPGDSETVGLWRLRMGAEEGKTKYKKRTICEWSNAHARNHGLQQLVVRGLKKVKAAVLWFALVQNLFRAVALRAAAATA